jgi:calcium/calmodulin-dependent protein kinase I
MYDEFKKYKSIDLPSAGLIKVTKDTNNKGVYTLDYSFTDSD